MPRFNDIAAEIEQLNRDLNAAVAAAQSHNDPHLTSDGLTAKRATLAKTARDAAGKKLQELKAAFDVYVNSAKNDAARVIPKAEGSTRDGWERVKMILDAGASLPQVVGQATPEQLHALAEWGPSWIAAQSAAARSTGLGAGEWQAPDASLLQRSIQGRWAEVLGGAAAQTIAEAMNADVVTAGIEQTAAHLATKAAGGTTVDPIAASLSAHYAQQGAQISLSPAGA
jgi:hypothetical protein